MVDVVPAPEWALSSRARTAVQYAAAVLGVLATWGVTIWAAGHLEPDPVLHDAALFVHLSALVVGMGAVLTLDWLSLRWLLGHVSRADVVRLAGSSHTLIWAGLVGLTVSGALLSPDPHAPLTRVKLVAVLVVALNGLHAHALQRRLDRGPLTRALLGRAAAVAAVSQAGWWTAVVVGYLNAG